MVSYSSEGAYAQSIELFGRAVAIHEMSSRADERSVMDVQINLGLAYLHIGDFTRASDMLTRAHSFAERFLGPMHPETGKGLSRLSSLYNAQGDLPQAEELQRRAIIIQEKSQGLDHPDVAKSLHPNPLPSAAHRREGARSRAH